MALGGLRAPLGRWDRAERPPLASDSASSAPLSILVVDDSAVARQALTVVLEHEGFHVSSAASAGEALEVVGRRSSAVDAILMHLQLPDGSGIDAFARIKRLAGWPDVPVIVVTSSDDAEDLSQAFAMSAPPASSR